MNEGWLTKENAGSKAEDLVRAIRQEIQQKNRPISTRLEGEARNAIHAANERQAILRDWFESSIGISFGGERETWYVTEASVGAQFAEFGVVKWTSWIGDLVTRVRNAVLDGKYPESLRYGAPGRESEEILGPFVEYIVRGGQVQKVDFKFREDLGGDIVELEEALTPVEPQYGLRTRIRTLDLAQNDQIRGPLNGIYILTGGPGTGKTTVGLHRIPYLIDSHSNPEIEIPTGTPEVTEENTLVVVWEPHLAPYLRSCLDALGLSQIPPANVALIRDWLSAELRTRIPFGPAPGYRRVEESDNEVARIKQALTETVLVRFLQAGPSLAEALKVELTDCVEETRKIWRQVEDQSAEFVTAKEDEAESTADTLINYRNVSGRVSHLMAELEKNTNRGDFATKTIARLKVIQSTIRGARIVAVLRAFYRSDEAAAVIADQFGDEAISRFNAAVSSRDRRLLSDLDRFLLLWIVDIPTTGELLRQPIEPLPRYGHIMIDEAQYYEPIVLRLLSRLCDVPRGTMTIVGDLEQRVTADGGLVKWESAGLSVPEGNIHRLDVNYRWSEPVFDFLNVFQSVSGIETQLTPPRRWFARKGDRPRVSMFESREDELSYVVDEISRIRNSEDGHLWTVAVIVPDAYETAAKEVLVQSLNDFAIAAAWAVGDQVRDSVHKVVVTKYNNIVGLEFNAVFVVGVNDILIPHTQAAVQSVWVAISRAHQHLHVSRVGSDPIFDDAAFGPYRS